VSIPRSRSIAEVGPTAATFPSEKSLSSWVGACPGDAESAGVDYSHRSLKCSRHMRRLLNQAANAAAKTKGSIFEIVSPLSPALGHNQAIDAIAHRQCSANLFDPATGSPLRGTGPAVTKRSRQLRTSKMLRQLRSLGYRIEPPNPQLTRAWGSSNLVGSGHLHFFPRGSDATPRDAKATAACSAPCCRSKLAAYLTPYTC
jgi:hypothetical protein